jgi:hypothetical protein
MATHLFIRAAVPSSNRGFGSCDHPGRPQHRLVGVAILPVVVRCCLPHFHPVGCVGACAGHSGELAALGLWCRRIAGRDRGEAGVRHSSRSLDHFQDPDAGWSHRG